MEVFKENCSIVSKVLHLYNFNHGTKGINNSLCIYSQNICVYLFFYYYSQKNIFNCYTFILNSKRLIFKRI
jgi:hypothetical protein